MPSLKGLDSVGLNLISQKVKYNHMNPVKAGLVFKAQFWKCSSAIDYSGGRGVLDIDFL